MNKKMCVLAATLILAALSISAAALQREQNVLSEKLIRLHVVANSDTDYDQNVKLMVRDAVLQTLEPELQNAEDPERVIEEKLADLQEVAEKVLEEQNLNMPVSVSLAYERFPTRVYDTFSLPAGVYRSLRVRIGNGDGKNWWCVVFPAICLPAAGEMEEAAVEAGLTRAEIGLITEADGRYVVKFKILEILQELQSFL